MRSMRTTRTRAGFIAAPAPRFHRPSSRLSLRTVSRPSLDWSRSHFRRPFITCQLDSSTGNYDASDIRVRIAKVRDIAAISEVTARAFCEQDEYLIMLRTKMARFKSFVDSVSHLYQFLSARDIATQLRTRLGPGKQAVHIVLVAEQPSSGDVMGCIEMGVVRIGKMATARAGDAIQQWEQAINNAKNQQQERSERGVLDEGRAPYIGNLAVSREFRRYGVASALVLESCRWARTLWAAQCVWLHVEETNYPAKQLYQKLGFGCEAREPNVCDDIGRRRRLFLRSEGGEQDWSKAKLIKVQMSTVEYLRWCWQDLKRTRQENERL